MPQPIRLVTIGGDSFLAAGCNLIRWSSVAAIAWNSEGKVVEIHLTTGGAIWHTGCSYEALDAFMATAKEAK